MNVRRGMHLSVWFEKLRVNLSESLHLAFDQLCACARPVSLLGVLLITLLLSVDAGAGYFLIRLYLLISQGMSTVVESNN